MFAIDFIFRDQASLELAEKSALGRASTYAALYKVPESDVQIFVDKIALIMKVAIPRKASSGSAGDLDILGGQFHAPFVDTEVSR